MIVMMIATGSLLTLLEQNHRSQSLNSVMTDLNFTLESMSRTIRTGRAYHCGSGGGNTSATQDCIDGGNMLFVTDQDGRRVQYRTRSLSGRVIVERRIHAGSGWGGWSELTSENVALETLTFFVTGSAQGDSRQPRVTIALSGTARRGGEVASFSIQTAVTQRILDL